MNPPESMRVYAIPPQINAKSMRNRCDISASSMRKHANRIHANRLNDMQSVLIDARQRESMVIKCFICLNVDPIRRVIDVIAMCYQYKIRAIAM